MKGLTWARYEDDSRVHCASGIHSLSPSDSVNLHECDDPSSPAFVNWAMDALPSLSSSKASPALLELSSCQACQASLFVDLNESTFNKSGGISEARNLSLQVQSVSELSVQQRRFGKRSALGLGSWAV